MHGSTKPALAVATLAIAAFPVHAGGLPRYDVDSYCQEVSDFSGGSAMLFNGCIDMEQEAYRGLQRIWDSVPARTAAYCNDVAQFSGGSYALLKGCLDMEREAASSRRTFEY